MEAPNPVGVLTPSCHHEQWQVTSDKLFHLKFLNAIMALILRFSTKLGIRRPASGLQNNEIFYPLFLIR
jgi:hypothetical protein